MTTYIVIIHLKHFGVVTEEVEAADKAAAIEAATPSSKWAVVSRPDAYTLTEWAEKLTRGSAWSDFADDE